MCRNHNAADDAIVTVKLCRIADIQLEKLAQSQHVTKEELLRALVQHAINPGGLYPCSS